ncbi:MAG TPA: class I SAM-dependent methyltransferase [Bacteroidales bacterium]|nr:class I SAM-dependent methyltransferase [Bacteroidales bacterium]
MNNFHASRAIEYFLTSGHRRGHRIYSPFIFNTVTGIIQNKTAPEIVNKVEEIRSELKKDKRIIQMSDLGAGSLKGKNYFKGISDIVRYSSVSRKYGSLLSRFASTINGRPIIELGTSLGISTLYLALGAPGSVVHTVEGCKNISEMAGETFQRAGTKNVRQYQGSFDEQLAKMISKISGPGLIFIDGDHRKESLLRYFSLLLGNAGKDTIIILDDIHLTPGMERGWREIKNSSEVSVSVDILRMGILFFIEDIAKQDVTIRY